MTDNTSLMQFPCEFIIKIIGKNSSTFADDVKIIVRRSYPDTKDTSFRIQPSQKNNYLALSVSVYALDQITLDALYLELTKHPDIKMVL